jgi:hypothetical protein
LAQCAPPSRQLPVSGGPGGAGSGHLQLAGSTAGAHRGGRGQGPASPAAPRAGTLHPRADRPVACWTGCHLAACAVKGRCALMSARSAFGGPLDRSGVEAARRDPVARGGRGP